MSFACSALSEVALQCRFVLLAFEQLQHVDAEEDEAYARASKRERDAPPFERGKVWREAQKDVPDARTILHADAFPRNHFEHFDKELATWFSDPHRRGGYVGRNIGGASGGDQELFRHYDPATGDLTFWTHAVNVFQIVEEAERILPRAEAESLKSWRDDANDASNG